MRLHRCRAGYDVASAPTGAPCRGPRNQPGAAHDLVRTAPRRLSCLVRLPPGRSMSRHRLLCAERGDHPVRSDRHTSPRLTRIPRRRPRRRAGAPPAGGCLRPRRLPHLRRARRPPRDRARARRGGHRAHVRHPGAHAAARARRRGRHRPGPHRHGQDARLRRPAAAAARAARRAARGHRRRRGRRPHPDVPQALVVVPTRELCVQVAKDLADAGRHLGVRVVAIYGGRAYEPQLAALRKGVDIVVGTPGRLLDLAEQRHLALGRVSALVLDEADEMLDLGFLPDVERIMRMLPEQRQTMLFSATMPGPIIALSRAFLNRPTHIRAEESDPGLGARAHPPARLPRARDGQGRAAHPRAAGRGPRPDHDLRPHQAHRAARRRRPRRARVRRRRRARRPRPGRPRAGAARVPLRQGRRAGGHRRRRPRHRRHRRHARRSTTSAPRTRRPTSTASAAPAGRARRASRSRSSTGTSMPRWKMVSDELGLGIDEPAETYSTSEHLYTDLAIPRTRHRAAAARQAHPRGPRGRVRRQRGRRRRPQQAQPRQPATATARPSHAGPRPQAPRPHPRAARIGRRPRRRRADAAPRPPAAEAAATGPSRPTPRDQPRRRRRRGGARRRGPSPADCGHRDRRTPPRAER